MLFNRYIIFFNCFLGQVLPPDFRFFIILFCSICDTTLLGFFLIFGFKILVNNHINYSEIKPTKPFYLFQNVNLTNSQTYTTHYISINELFNVSTTGIVTARDDLVIDEKKDQLLKLRELLNEVPMCARDYIYDKQITSQTSTLVSYTYDLLTFFRFLQQNNPYFANKAILDFKIDELALLSSEDINEYQRYLELNVVGEKHENGTSFFTDCGN